MATVSYALLNRQVSQLLGTFRDIRKLQARPHHLVEALGFKGQFPSRIEVVRPREYRFMRRTEATTAYLKFAAIPQTSAQIEAAVTHGGVRTKAVDSLAAQYGVMHHGKETGRFRRYGTKHWVLG